VIGDYTARSLSYASDALNAAAGVLNHLSQGDNAVLNFAGLPYYTGTQRRLQPISVGSAIDTRSLGALSARNRDEESNFPHGHGPAGQAA
jgi:hypothetical protein